MKLCHALVSGGVPAHLEPVGLCGNDGNDGKKLDGMSLIPWSWGLPYPYSGTLPVQTF